jgi:hypothetical protein
MSCEQNRLVQRLAVEDAEALEGGAWQEHFTERAECREERNAYAQSLAIFKQLESERIAQTPRVPSWEALSKTLSLRSGPGHRLGSFSLPLVSGAAGILLVAGLLSWYMLGAGSTGPQETAADGPEQERAEEREQWTISPEQLNANARPAPPRRQPIWLRGDKTQSFVFEVKGDPRSPFTVGIGTGGPQPAEEALNREQRLSLPPVGEQERGWQPPTTTPVSAGPYPVQYPAFQEQRP